MTQEFIGLGKHSWSFFSTPSQQRAHDPFVGSLSRRGEICLNKILLWSLVKMIYLLQHHCYLDQNTRAYCTCSWVVLACEFLPLFGPCLENETAPCSRNLKARPTTFCFHIQLIQVNENKDMCNMCGRVHPLHKWQHTWSHVLSVCALVIWAAPRVVQCKARGDLKGPPWEDVQEAGSVYVPGREGL